MDTATGLSYRFLVPEDWEQLAAFFKDSPEHLPDPSTAVIAGAFDNGTLVGFVHAKPTFIIGNAWAGRKGTMETMLELLDQAIAESGPREYVLILNEADSKLALKQAGYEKTTSEVWRKKV